MRPIDPEHKIQACLSVGRAGFKMGLSLVHSEMGLDWDQARRAQPCFEMGRGSFLDASYILLHLSLFFFSIIYNFIDSN